MDSSFLQIPPVALTVSTLACAAIAFTIRRISTPISPTIPYAGKESLLTRLRVPKEYAADPVAFMCKTRKQLGDVFCVDMFALRIIYMLGPEANKAFLRTVEEDCSLLEPSSWTFGPAFKNTMRDPEFLSFSVKFFKAELSKQEFLDANFARCKAIAESHFDSWAKQGVVPLFPSMSELIVSMATVFLFGSDFFEKHGKEFVPLLIEYERLVQQPLLRLVPNSLWWLTPPGRTILRMCQRVDEMMELEMHALAADLNSAASRVDYFARIVCASGGPLNNKFPLDYIGRHVQSMAFASRTNSANTIPWLFLHARRHPHALERIREGLTSTESDSAKAPGRVPRPYLDACLRETARLYTNMTLLRQTRKPVCLMGHEIPANTFVAISPVATQRAGASAAYDAGPGTSIYENAGAWDPERFLADGGRTYIESFRRHEFVQFGAYQHACPGEKLAKMFIFDIVLQTWFEDYEIEVVSGLREGERGIDGVGADAAWAEDNVGTPGILGDDVMVSVKKRH